MSFDKDYLIYFNNIISDHFNIPLDRFKSNFNHNCLSIILKVEYAIVNNYIIDNSKFKLNTIKDFENIFRRVSLPIVEITRRKILYHDIKNNLIKAQYKIKLVFNRYSLKYELHNLIDNKIDWKSSSTVTSYNKWADSFKKYQSYFVDVPNK